MAKILNDADFLTLENTVLDMLSAMDEDGLPADDLNRRAMEQAYNNFEQGSNTGETLAAVRAAAAGYNAGWAAVIDRFLVGAIRTSNYPSAFDQNAKDALTAYKNVLANQGFGGQHYCQGYNRGRHLVAALTIDHDEAVASHWNRAGYNTSRANRRTWYNDPGNHVYLCQACNSSKGSGGVNYRMDTGLMYTN